jgi:hypothetical protein
MAGTPPRILLPCAGANREVTLLVKRTNHEWPGEARMSLLDVLRERLGARAKRCTKRARRQLALLDALKGTMS